MGPAQYSLLQAFPPMPPIPPIECPPDAAAVLADAIALPVAEAWPMPAMPVMDALTAALMLPMSCPEWSIVVAVRLLCREGLR